MLWGTRSRKRAPRDGIHEYWNAGFYGVARLRCPGCTACCESVIILAMPYNFKTIEKKWQTYWLKNKTFAALDPQDAGMMPKAYILDMFPYPSGAGLHVGHPVGYLATDILSRYRRMLGYNVLHPIGWDAFGLPAEQYAIDTNTHPRQTTVKNIDNFRRQLQSLGLSYDWDREVDTTDPKYYRWTQWIFLQLFNSYFDPMQQKAMPIEHLMQELVNENYVVAPDQSIHVNPTQEGLEEISGEVRVERLWRELPPEEQRDVIETQRLAYRDEVAVNWCPALGTVLSNEEVIDGLSERGKHPVERRPMLQWMLRITAYADRLLDDLDLLTWPESLKEMQRNWIGKSVGAEVDFDIVPGDGQQPALEGEPTEDAYGDEALTITVFTTRPDTLFGATYMVLAPEHPLVDRITSSAQAQAVLAYRAAVASRSERDRIAETKDKTGVFTGAMAINPVNQEQIPIYLADYVLMSYGTGAIMAVPAHDERDYQFATRFNLAIRTVVKPLTGDAPVGRAFETEGEAINSPMIDGLTTQRAKEKIIDWLEDEGVGHRAIKYKLRDWLFSRQRYWGEPFPILLDRDGNAYPVREDELPITLPPMDDFKPTGTPEPPLSKVREWVRYELSGSKANAVPAAVSESIETAFGHLDVVDLFRETNTMPQWAGSCWYYLRYIDPTNDEQLVDPVKQAYWMPVDLYVGGAEHAVLHLLYARFWHKVLFDRGHVTTPEPFARLVNQGLILGEMEFHSFVREDGSAISAADLTEISEEATAQGSQLVAIEKVSGKKVAGSRMSENDVEKSGDGYRLKSNPQIRVDARSFKMSKSRGNTVNPDKIMEEYGSE